MRSQEVLGLIIQSWFQMKMGLDLGKYSNIVRSEFLIYFIGIPYAIFKGLKFFYYCVECLILCGGMLFCIMVCVGNPCELEFSVVHNNSIGLALVTISNFIVRALL